MMVSNEDFLQQPPHIEIISFILHKEKKSDKYQVEKLAIEARIYDENKISSGFILFWDVSLASKNGIFLKCEAEDKIFNQRCFNYYSKYDVVDN